MTLEANATFALDNIALLLFLDIVTWFSESNSSKMKYLYPETVQFWRIGQKLFHGRFLRFISGRKNQGQIVQGSTYRGVCGTKESFISLAVRKEYCWINFTVKLDNSRTGVSYVYQVWDGASKAYPIIPYSGDITPSDNNTSDRASNFNTLK